jgi:hypothetical protein
MCVRRAIIKLVPALKSFRNCPWASGAHAQTFFSLIKLGKRPTPRRDIVVMADGVQIVLDWFDAPDTPHDAPLVVTLHGIGGRSNLRPRSIDWKGVCLFKLFGLLSAHICSRCTQIACMWLHAQLHALDFYPWVSASSRPAGASPARAAPNAQPQSIICPSQWPLPERAPLAKRAPLVLGQAPPGHLPTADDGRQRAVAAVRLCLVLARA